MYLRSASEHYSAGQLKKLDARWPAYTNKVIALDLLLLCHLHPRC